MSNLERNINKILTNVKPLTVKGITDFCKSELKKYYSEAKVHNLELAQDYVISNYINNVQHIVESDEYIPF